METAIVTGAAGFVGANLVRRLLADGVAVTILVRPASDTWRLPPPGAHGALTYVRGTLDDMETAFGAVASAPDCVFHLAAAGVDQSSHDVAEMIHTNVVGTARVLKFSGRWGARRFVYVGSSGEYGPAERAREDQAPAPNSEYGATKVAGWCLAHAFGLRTGLPVVSVRPFSVFGPYEAPYRLVPYCIARALDGEPIEVTDGRQTRDYVYIDDVVDGIVRAARTPDAVGRTFNLCSGTNTAVRDMVTRIVDLAGTRVEPSFGARAQATTEMWTTSGDPSAAAAVLGWKPETPVDEGLVRTIDWFVRRRAAGGAGVRWSGNP